ncbi:hypothetical protein [Streptomyces armeniacus]|uniref:hypothetical protein n=1 Tax=Streptomyces armeniacus TaxID=83291 RepID=UPI001AD8489F|nr:hypothetical protein [Streptomyces armeniacus]
MRSSEQLECARRWASPHAMVEGAMGDHRKPEPDPGQGKPPPGNADGEVPKPPPSGGKHKKD